MAPGTLILIKHAQTLLTPEVTAEHWRLSDQGLAQCAPLAERLGPYGPGRVISSTEVKAIETAQLVARYLGVPHETAVGLHEHDRSNVRLVPREEFERHMAEMFAHPNRLIYGRETASEAYLRFRAAVERVCREYAPAGESGEAGRKPPLAIVSHGTVIALLVARANGLDPLELWLKLTTPSLVVVSLPTFALREIVAPIG